MAGTEALIGLDLGTTSIKGVALSLGGSVLDRASAPTPTLHLPGGLYEHDPEAMWGAVCSVLSALTERGRTAGRQAIGLAIASMGEAGVPVDANGATLHPIIGWLDPRAAAQMRGLEARLGASRLQEITGHPIDAHWGITRLMWLSEERPELFARTTYWLSVGDFILHRLSGVAVTDQSLASRMMAFDQRAGRWSDEVLESAGITDRLLPRVAPSGSAAGTVTSSAARVTGLSPGVPISLGGHDRACGALAARGGTDCAVDSAGTAEALMVSLPMEVAQDLPVAPGLARYFDVVPGRQLICARVGLAGGLVEWVTGQMFGGVTDAGVFSSLASDGGFSGVICFPAFGRSISPEWVPGGVPGAFVGVTAAHTRNDLLRAALEGVCFSLRSNVTAIEELLGRPLGPLRVEGGVVRSRAWLEMKADILGRSFDSVMSRDLTAVGAALLAGVGAGCYPDATTAAAALELPMESWLPRAEAARIYEDAYQRLYCPTAELMVRLARGDTDTASSVVTDQGAAPTPSRAGAARGA